MIGTYISCVIVVTLWQPILKTEVTESMELTCKVVDAMKPVGTPDYVRHPVLLDCTEDIKWLEPVAPRGPILKHLEDCDEI